MKYFKIICTKGVMQPYFEDAARKHETALNAYLALPTAGGKKREVESQSTVQVVHNMEIITTTTLCCEDYEEGEK
jgi:hypothetical protein